MGAVKCNYLQLIGSLSLTSSTGSGLKSTEFEFNVRTRNEQIKATLFTQSSLEQTYVRVIIDILHA
jgi:hypothetical protein